MISPGIAALAARVLSPRTGLIRGLQFLPAQGNSIGLFHCVGMTPNYAQLPCGRDIQRAGGIGTSAEEAAVKVIFEGLERYAGAHIDYSRLVWSRATSDRFLCGDRYPLYADWQYAQPDWPFRPLTADNELYWARGTSLFDLETRFVPAGLVYVPYLPAAAGDNLALSTSSGMAAGRTREEAQLSGLLETIERDAFMIMWLNGLSMPILQLAPDCPTRAQIEARLRHSGAACTFVDLTTDIGIPVVMAVMRHRAYGHELTTLGLSAKPDWPGAALKAFFEASSSYERIRFQLEQNGHRLPELQADFADFRGLETRDVAYAAPSLQRHLDFLTASERRVEHGGAPVLAGETADERLFDALQRLRPCVREVVAVDLVPPDVASLQVAVQKVMVPDLVPLTSDHRFPWLGHRRIYEVPVRMGLRSASATAAELNPLPHPFA